MGPQWCSWFLLLKTYIMSYLRFPSRWKHYQHHSDRFWTYVLVHVKLCFHCCRSRGWYCTTPEITSHWRTVHTVICAVIWGLLICLASLTLSHFTRVYLLLSFIVKLLISQLGTLLLHPFVSFPLDSGLCFLHCNSIGKGTKNLDLHIWQVFIL